MIEGRVVGDVREGSSVRAHDVYVAGALSVALKHDLAVRSGESGPAALGSDQEKADRENDPDGDKG